MKKKNAIDLFKEITKDMPKPVKKEGTTIIEKGNKVYAFHYNKKKKK